MSWLLVFLGFSLLIILHEAGHFFAAKATGMRVEKFFLFFGPKLVSIKRGETEYGIATIPIGGFVKISGMSSEEELPPEVEPRAYYRQSVWKRIVVIGAGPAVNILLAFAILVFIYFADAQQATQSVGEVRSGTPASKVLKIGDKILAVNGRSYANLSSVERQEKLGEAIASHGCQQKEDGCLAPSPAPVRLTIGRKGAVQTIAIRPEYRREYGTSLIGVSYKTVPESISVGTAATRALDTISLVARKTGSVFARVFESKQRKEISGVVGISDAAHQTIDVGVYPSLFLLAIVSLSLGLINLLPILPLDGGHIFWSLIEKLRGTPVSLRTMERASAVGIVLVAMLFFIGLTNDIGRITGEGIHVR
ncbi:MAG: regulator of sigma protease [Solirubrobacterales bacterium]|jgi:regulator of sigma E protease|nr:regulator of sigma protease [Solirubrobacterales bacterium]